MKNTMRIVPLFASFCFFLIFSWSLIACAPTVVPLTPPVAQQNATPFTINRSVCVVLPTDDRAQLSIGMTKDGSAIAPSGNIADWVGRALADELVQHGFTVTYAQSLEFARNSNPDYVLVSKVNEVWLREVSSIEYSSSVKVTANLMPKGSHVTRTQYGQAQMTKKGLLTQEAVSKILAETLADALNTLVLNFKPYLEQ